MYSKDDKKYAKKIIKIAKKHPDYYTESEVRYAKMIKKRIKFMKDQNSIESDDETHVEKWNRALDIFIESVHKPDSELRSCAHNQKCFNELMSVREDVINHLRTLRK
tara:strand:+ start:100 stop:420 length:321 start_codon:yes stop_codon:yes gene_type:complete